MSRYSTLKQLCLTSRLPADASSARAIGPPGWVISKDGREKNAETNSFWNEEICGGPARFSHGADQHAGDN